MSSPVSSFNFIDIKLIRERTTISMEIYLPNTISIIPFSHFQDCIKKGVMH